MTQFIIFAIFILSYVFLGQFIGLGGENDELVGGVPMALIKFLLSMFFFINGIRYVIEWGRVSQHSFLLVIVMNVIVPFTTLFWMFKYNVLLALSDHYVAFLALLAYVFYILTCKKMIVFVKDKMAMNDSDAKFLFKTYPPKTRLDMIGVDVVMLGMWLLPLIFSIE